MCFSGIHLARCSWGNSSLPVAGIGTHRSIPITLLHHPGQRFVSTWLCTWPMRTLGGWPLLASKLVSSLSVPLLKMMLFIHSSLTHSFTDSICTYYQVNKGFNVYIQDKIYWELFKSRFDLRQSPSPLMEISLLKGKQPETSVKIPSISLYCGRPGQGILKII